MKLRNVQYPEREDAVYNYRPFGLAPPPITIYSPVFADFMAAMEEDFSTMSFSHQELEDAHKVVVASTAYYWNKGDRLATIRERLGSLVPQLKLLLEGQSRKYNKMEVKPDGIVALDAPWTDNIVVTIVEAENEIGEGHSDPIARAECVYVAMYTSPEVGSCH